MNKKSIFTVIALICLPVSANAGIFICHNEDGSITNRVFSGGAVYSNNPDCIRVTPDQYTTVMNATHKMPGGVIIELTQQEIDDRIAAQVAAAAAREATRVKNFDDNVDSSQTGDATLPKIDAVIDGIDSFTKLKAYLKKKARFDLNR